jgi:hypothetical protein
MAEISYTLTDQDYVDASRAQYASRLKSPKRWALALVVVLVICGLFAYADSYDLESFLFNSVPYVGIIVAAFLLGPLLTYLWIGRWARRTFQQQKANPENRMSWDDEGLRLESELGSLRAKWSDFYGWKKSGQMFMVHMNEALYYVVPAHALTPEQAADLEQKLTEHRVVRR